MIINKIIKTRLIFLLVIAIILTPSLIKADILTYGDDQIVRCRAIDKECMCNDISGEEYRCDNTDETGTLESHITIDDCEDGSEIVSDIIANPEDYQYIKNIERIDENGTSDNHYPDGSYDSLLRGGLRAGDKITVNVDMLCQDETADEYAILYKNNTNPLLNDWKIIQYDNCNMEGEIYTETISFKLDNVVGNHTIRAIVSACYDQTLDDSFEEENYCGYSSSSESSDTDDLIIEVLTAPDYTDPTITPITPQNLDEIEYVENLIVPVIFNVSDQTGIDTLNLTLIYYSEFGQVNTTLNLTKINNYTYTANITGISAEELGEYALIFYANDTIPTNSTNHTFNHVNNYTSINFTIVNNAGISITSPLANSNHITLSNMLDFRITDLLFPFHNVNYILNNIRTNLSDSKYKQISNNTINAFNNSNNNISQSFTLDYDINMYNIGLKVKKIGDGIKNHSLILREDSAGPYGAIVGYAKHSNISNSSYTWTKFVFNKSINLSNGEKYWVTLLKDNNTNYLEWAYDNDVYADGEYENNSSIDMNLRVYKSYEYNSTLNSDVGTNSLKVCEQNLADGMECSFVRYYVDTDAPYFLSNASYTNPLQLGSSQTISINIADAVTGVNTAFLNFNNTNLSMSKSGNIYSKSLPDLNIGSYNFSIFANDSVGWSNQTETYFFTVNDTLAPVLSNLIYYPNATNDIDPNVTLKFNFTLTDYSTISTIYLQYRLNSTSVWTNVTPSSLGSNKYQAIFTPLNESKYVYRIYAKDAIGNILNSTNQSIDVFYDRYWSIYPNIYSQKNVNGSTTLNIYNVTVINYGDIKLRFSIQKGPLVDYTMNFSETTFNISANDNVTIKINITTPDTQDEKRSAHFTVNCLDNCKIPSLSGGNYIQINGEGPYLDTSIDDIIGASYSKSTNIYTFWKGDILEEKQYTLITTIKNIGNQPAENITFNFTFFNQSRWIKNITNPQNLVLNFSLDQSGYPNDHKTINITFVIKKNAPKGTIFNISSFAALIYNGTMRNDTDISFINITETKPEVIESDNDGGGSGTTTTTTTNPSISNPGGSNAAGAGLGAGLTLTYNLTIKIPNNIDIQRGQNKTITVNITNPYKNKYYANIVPKIAGFNNNFILFHTNQIDMLNFNETISINITFTAPSYLSYSVNSLELSFDYMLVSTGQNITTGLKQTSSKKFNLIINEINREESFECLMRSISIINNASGDNYSTIILEEKLETQRNAIASMDFTLAKQVCDEIKSSYEEIIYFDKTLDEIKISIDKSTKQGYDLSDVKRLYNITLDAFINGDYKDMAKSIKDLESAYALQIKIEDSDLIKRFVRFIKNNLIELSIFFIIFSILSYYSYGVISKIIINNKINSLKHELPQINDKIQELQKKYFSEKSISQDYFNLHTQKYKDRITQINESLVTYQTISLKFDKKSKTLSSLKDREEKVKELIKVLQHRYYTEKSIDKDSFERITLQYNKTLNEIRKQILINKNRIEIRNNSKFQTKKREIKERLLKLINKNNKIKVIENNKNTAKN